MTNKSDFLIERSYKRLWQSPGQDIQYVVAPSRVTPRRGALGKITLGMKEYTLPTRGDWYSVFVFGDLPHFMVGVDEFINKWVSVQAHCNNSNTLISIYDDRGLVYPTFDAYFLYTRDGQVAIALKNHQKTLNVLDDQIYIKWRSSSWFNIPNNLVQGEGIVVQGKVITSRDDVSILSARWLELNARPGYLWVYKNGRRISRAHATTLQVGDYVELVWDGSVREVLKYKLKELDVFTSDLDKKSKYLIPNVGYGETIDYRDDIDMFIMEHWNENEYDGVYYHHNQEDTIRNVTHRDFSTPTAYVIGVIEANVRWNLASDLRLEVLIRHSGWIRPIPDVHVKLYDLFRLPHQKRLEALTGEQSLIPEWTASNLESSSFNELMDKSDGYISLELATRAFEYSAISKMAGPVVYERGESNSIRLGALYHYRSTVYEYNAFGKLLGRYLHTISPDYRPHNEHCAYVEVYYGWPGLNMGTVFGKQEQKLDAHSDYRFYIAQKQVGESYDNWVDVTGDESKYQIDDTGKLTWKVSPSSYLTAVRKDCDFLDNTIELDRMDRLLLLSIQTDNLYQDRGELKGWLEIPPGEMDVFLNGYHLVEGIDYYVNWPEICITNIIYRSPTLVNKIQVRARGFCNKDMTRRKLKDFGFVYNRKLLSRDRYFVMEDKVNVIHSNGRLVPVDWAFENEWERKLLPESYNGKPYQIRNPVIPLKNLVNETTTELLEKSEEIDKRIEDYLTDKLGIEDTELPRDINYKYPVMSPFMSKLLHDLLNGILPIDEFMTSYSDEFLLDKLSRYNYLLEYEPTYSGYLSDFMEVHPHPYLKPVEVNVYQYRILDRASKLIFKDKVALDKTLLVIEPGFEHDARYHPHPKRVL